PKMQTLLRLVRACRPFWGKMALSVGAMAGMTLLGLVPPLLLRTLVDQVLGPAHRQALLAPLVCGMLAVQVGSAGLVAAQLWLALVALAPVPLMGLLMLRFARQVRPRHLETREQLASVSGRLQDNLTGVRVIKAFSQEPREENRFGSLVRDHYRSQLAALAVWGRYNPSLAFLNG